LTLRGRDLVGLGLDGHRWGFGLPSARRRARVQAALDAVGARYYADAPVGLLSGGEQQRLRVAQALVGDPDVLLCDEPLLSLDPAHQQVVSGLIDARRRTAGTAVLFVTHEINPVLPAVDRVLYLVDSRFRIGTPDEVMNSATLSQLYRTDVEVIKVRGQLLVIGIPGGHR
ncbi:MAG: ATP-binding cassette domain-containing protein, partial [Actinomycetota bacterium]|nr:ATP-binding cassette domain-containing protein [Actinomycetota bacterium]